jgi:16S rRNA (cytidine1402-2'-O)-methyltransferase
VSDQLGRLLLCPTPLGNLEDITLRTLRALRECDVIFAEDTRVSEKLLRHYEIKKPLRSFHERVAAARTAELQTALRAGKTVAVITDAGMPGISDPGVELVRAAREIGSPVEVLPGPSASLAALVLSGFDVARFRFDGFPPRKSGERRRYLQRLEHELRPVVWFESAHRIHELLSDVAAVLPQRRVFVLREYTKKFEQHITADAAAALQQLTDARGEFTIVLEAAAEPATPQADTAHLREAIAVLRAAGVGARTIAQALHLASGVAKNELYRLVTSEQLPE